MFRSFGLVLIELSPVLFCPVALNVNGGAPGIVVFVAFTRQNRLIRRRDHRVVALFALAVYQFAVTILDSPGLIAGVWTRPITTFAVLSRNSVFDPAAGRSPILETVAVKVTLSPSLAWLLLGVREETIRSGRHATLPVTT
jgi:hypothetical protein